MTEIATFAAGCFWGVEETFLNTPGVIDTEVGYTGGTVPDPSYEQVCFGATRHAEAVRVTFDPAKVSYEQLLKVFWDAHDPTQKNRQGPDIGSQYRSGIFFHSAEQEKIANKSKETLEMSGKLGKPVTTEIIPAAEFYPAEEYHQKYVRKNGGAACHI